MEITKRIAFAHEKLQQAEARGDALAAAVYRNMLNNALKGGI